MFVHKVLPFVCIVQAVFLGVLGKKTCPMFEQAYRLDIPDHFCRPCSSSVSLNKKVSYDGNCPNVKNVTHVFVEQLEINMRAVASIIEKERREIHHNLQADETFIPLKIEDLQSIERSPISAHLRSSTKPEETIHRIYARVILLSGYLNLVQCMLDDITTVSNKTRQDLNRSLTNLNQRIIPLTCQLYAFTKQIGISKIKKRICRYAEKIKLNGVRDVTNFILTVLTDGSKYAKESVDELISLPTAMEKCKFKKCSGNKLKLSCSEEDENKHKRNSRKTRNDRKIRRNKKKGKGRRNRKNKGRKGRRQRNKSRKQN